MDLAKDFDRLWQEHGLDALQVARRVLTDPALPQGLRDAVLQKMGGSRFPEVAEFLARLVLGHDIVPGTRAPAQALTLVLANLQSEAREASLNALCRDALEHALASDDPNLRGIGVSGHAILRGFQDTPEERLRFLLDLYQSDSSWEVRAAVQNRLVVEEDVAQSPGASERMLSLFESSVDPAERRSLLHMLAATKSEQARRTVLSSLSDPSEDVRRAAVFEAGRFGAPEAVPSLAAMLVDPATDAATREAYVLRALAAIPSPQAARVVLESRCAEDPHWAVKALNALLESPGAKDPSLAADLIRVHRGADDPQIRDLAARLLWRNSSVEAYSALRQSFLESDGEERKELGGYILLSTHRGDFVRSSFDDLVRIGLDRYAFPELFAVDPPRAVREVAKHYFAPGRLTEDGRRSAIEGLAGRATPESTDLLRRILQVETDETLRSIVESELRRRDDP